jgi:hypothetical protein
MPPILKLPAEIITYTSTFLDGHEVDQWAHTDFDNFLEAMLCTPGVCETPPTPTTAFGTLNYQQFRILFRKPFGAE